MKKKKINYGLSLLGVALLSVGMFCLCLAYFSFRQLCSLIYELPFVHQFWFITVIVLILFWLARDILTSGFILFLDGLRGKKTKWD